MRVTSGCWFVRADLLTRLSISAILAEVRQFVNQKVNSLTKKLISAAQCRGARGMLGWSQDQLAKAANVSRATVVDFERGAREPHANNLAAIRSAFESAGIDLIPENGSGDGVRFKDRTDGW